MRRIPADLTSLALAALALFACSSQPPAVTQPDIWVLMRPSATPAQLDAVGKAIGLDEQDFGSKTAHRMQENGIQEAAMTPITAPPDTARMTFVPTTTTLLRDRPHIEITFTRTASAATRARVTALFQGLPGVEAVIPAPRP